MIMSANARQFSQRIILLYLFVFFFFGILIRQLWHLQVEKSGYYRDLASKNRFRSVAIPAPRGFIYDVRGDIMVDNRPRFDLTTVLEDIIEVTTPEKEAKLIADILNRPFDLILKKITDKSSHLPYEPSVILTDLTMEEVGRLSEKQYLLSGVDLKVLPVRHYANEKTACHVLGYTGKISPAAYETLKEEGYGINDETGKTGIEAAYENYLRGIPGGRQIQINSFGRLDRIFGEQKPVKGYDVYLTIDLKIQKVIENAFEGRGGAAVVMETDTGNIIAMVSQPGFDPNIFATGISEKIQGYFVAPSFPLLNRAIYSEFAPGSIFKPVVALAALQKGLVNGDTSVFCNGVFKLGNISFRCWRKYGHGETNLLKAIEQSCNVYFYNIGKEIGYEPIYEMGSKFGLGQKTGIIIGDEKTGILPCEEWKQKKFKSKDQQKWHLGDTINYSIGQGYILVTPMQMACVTAAIATGGLMPEPNLLYKIVNNEGETILKNRNTPPRKIDISQEHIDIVRTGMMNVINAKYGTGRKARISGITAAGKTGTAQVKTRNGETQNAWFICFAPYENPKIAVVILIEGGESGGETAAPVAKKILSAYFNIALPQDTPQAKPPAESADSENVGDVTATQEEGQAESQEVQ